MRENWLSERERVWKVVGVMGINVVIAVLSAWASVGTWPWPRWQTAPSTNLFDEKVGGMVEGLVKGIEDTARNLLRSTITGQ